MRKGKYLQQVFWGNWIYVSKDLDKIFSYIIYNHQFKIDYDQHRLEMQNS